MWLIPLLACSGPTVALDPVATPAVAPPDERIVTRTLDNGVQVSVLPNDHPEDQAYVVLLVDVGFEHEAEDAKGAAHFVEHMFFNGTRSFPGETLVPWLEERGVPFGHGANASTSGRHTWYVLQLDSRTEEVMQRLPVILRDAVDGITFDPVAVEAERNILVAEMEMRSGSSDDHPGGTPEAYRTISAETLVDFHRTFYRSDRVHLVVVGDVESEPILAAYATAFDDLPRPTRAAPTEPPVPTTPPAGDVGTHSLHGSAAITLADSEDAAAELLIAGVLEERVAELEGHAGVNRSVVVYAGTDAGTLLQALALSVPPTDDELTAALDAALLGWVDQPFAHTPVHSGAWMSQILTTLVREDRLPSDPAAELLQRREALVAISPDEVRAVWRSIADPDGVTFDLRGPEFSGAYEPLPEPMVAQLRTQAATATRSAQPLESPAPPAPTPGDVDRVLSEGSLTAWRTPQGVELLHRHDAQLPVAIVDLRVPHPLGSPRAHASARVKVTPARDLLVRELSYPGVAVDRYEPEAPDDALYLRVRVIPDQLGPTLRALVDALVRAQADFQALEIEDSRIAVVGPTSAEAVEEVLRSFAGRSLGSVDNPPAPPPADTVGSLLLQPGFVTAYWRRRTASAEEAAHLPYLAAAWTEALRLSVREELGQAYKMAATVTASAYRTELKVTVTPRDGEHEAIAAELEAIRARLIAAPLDDETWRRAVMTARSPDPEDPDPIDWLDALRARQGTAGSLVEAATAPVPPEPSPEELRALAELWLPEPIQHD